MTKPTVDRGKIEKSRHRRPPMPDTSPHRSWTMAQVRQKNTKPEMIVRRLVYGLGYRYRIHKRGLPGTPDLVFHSRKKVVFVHGCFWHGHADENCKFSRRPKSRAHYWEPKLVRNAERDAINEERLRLDGWDVLVVWECQLRNSQVLAARISDFLGPTAN
ncbi:very short patch repair endonuclease [Rhizobium leguminosarum]|uniref:very short patch repair endonuclease n=1 Tax=Rhizobium leguminosarum TaxID=384 RepID=UPI0032AFA3DD